MATGSRRPEVGLFRRGMRVVAELIRLHPGPFAVSVVGAAVFAAATVAATIVLGRVTDRVVLPTFETGEPPEGAVATAVWAIAAVTVLRATGVVLRRYFAAMTAELAQTTLRRRLAERYLGLPLSWHQRVPTGQLLAHADNDSEVTADVLHPLPFSLGVVFLGLFSTISLLSVDVTIAGVALMIFPALVLLNRAYSRRIEGPAAAVQAAVGDVSSIAHESFDGALVVKTLGRAEAENERFGVAVRRLQEQRRQVGFVRSGFEAALDALPSLGIVAVVIVGAVRIRGGAMTVGDLVQVASLFTILALPMRVFGFFLETLPPSVVARRRLQSVFDEPVVEPLRRTGGVSIHPSLEAQGVGFTHPPSNGNVAAGGGRAPLAQRPVLDDLSLKVEPGEVLALVGPTGSGKSTLCTLLAGLVSPDRGRILIGGVPLAEIDAERRAELIALVFQEPFLFADTLRANVVLEPEGAVTPLADLDREDALRRALATAQVDRFLGELPDGLDTTIGERGVTLSGGQRQRVALARALVRRPRIILLDDATSAVDAVVEQQILAGLREELAATTVIVAQRISTIELADRVAFLRDGAIAAVGSHDQLLADPDYAALARAYEAGEP